MTRERAEEWVRNWDALMSFKTPAHVVKCLPTLILFATAEQRKEDAEKARRYADNYPTDIFIEPPPGEHGQTVDACSARAARHTAEQIAHAIEEGE